MATTTAQEIPRDGWPSYFDDLSRQYQGWAVTIELLDRELGDQRGADDVPFQGISYEWKGGSQGGDILVETGDVGTPYSTLLIQRPRAVRASATRPGDETDIEFESGDGSKAVVRIRRRAQLPPAPAGA